MKIIYHAFLFIGAMIAQWAWSTYLPIAGIAPQVLMILVIALASESGPVAAMNYGFFWGLFLDLLGIHLFGANALALATVGYGVGALRRQMDVSSPLSQIFVVGAVSVLYLIFLALVGLIFERHVFWPGWGAVLLCPLFNCLITPAVFPASRGVTKAKG